MDHHTLAAVSISGTVLDVLGSLYLAYDLLGGQHGPLRWLTRAVTYSLVFGIGYGLGLGMFFGLAAGIATGITVSINSIARLVGSIITPCLGRLCFPLSAGWGSERDCTECSAFDTHWPLPF